MAFAWALFVVLLRLWFLCSRLLAWAPRAVSGLAARYARGRRPASLMVLLVVPRVFRAPEAPAAREARRPHFVRRRASKPARALRTLRRPPHQWCLGRCSAALRVVSKPCQAPPPTGTTTRPTNPFGALARQALAPLTHAPTPNFARNSPTTLSNFEFGSLELQHFRTSLKLQPIELRATFPEASRPHHPSAPQPGPLIRV